MIRKPKADWGRESVLVSHTRSAVVVGAAATKAGTFFLRGLVCWGFAVLWGFAALGGLLGGSLPTFIGVGGMAAFMAWSGKRMFAKARS